MNETVKMINYKDLVGKQTFFAREKRFAGTVKYIVFLLDQKKAAALILEKGMMKMLKNEVLFTDITDVNDNKVRIKSKSSMMTVKELKRRFSNTMPGNYQGKKICNKTGKEYGRVYDIIINLYTGAVEAVEASDGLLQDAYDGRKLIPFMDQVEFADEMIILDKITEEEISMCGGLKDSNG